ncbi:hypothetical protein BRADI_2g52520v3 [Brachypodium distachyon]|uniref:Bifunctional inhibitor/plant lipid transfer protein/seed storage helical domain-containing protein n=2 Tax=Brachypodium distachyon TaxID=15368 RepID=I1HSI6_BRADI|nr:hypothetical protein BRADI_2g52520v3 [Brachypodium distachyon]
MARLAFVCLVLLTFAMAVAGARPPTNAPAAAPVASGPGNCDSDLQDLITNCQDYVKFPADPKITPSAACCAVIQRVNIPCLCNKVTPSVELVICMDKVVFVAAYCKRPFKSGSNCGSFHVPLPIA